MRLDKFLKISRLIKRRTVAKSVADQGRIKVNGRVAKSGTNVDVGDEIQIEFGNKIVTVRVDALKESTKKADAKEMFTLLHQEQREEKATPEFY